MLSRYRKIFSIACILGIGWLGGCNNEVQVTEQVGFTASPIIDASPVAITLTTTPATTATPTPTILPTTTPTKKPTTTPIPTLGAEEALAFVRQMQTTNGGCGLPCWWGITPGETTRAQAEQILAPLDAYIIPYSDDFLLRFPDYSGLWVDVYGRGDEPISWIDIRASYYGSDGSGRRFPFDESWYLYSLEGVLEQWGPPSKVWLGFGPQIEDAAISFGELFVFYNDLGLVIEYDGVAERTGAIVEGCFDLDQLVDIRISITTPMYISGPPWEYETDTQMLETVTDLTPEIFHERFQGADSICIESPVDLWPFLDRLEE